MSDTYTRVVLTVIAAALVAIALRGFGGVVPPAHAADTLDCRLQNGVTVSDFRDTLEVKLERSSSIPGSSSGSPLYVKMVD